MNGLHMLALAAMLVGAWLLIGFAARLSARHHAVIYQGAVSDVLLLLARDDANRARQDAARATDHADDAQVLLNSILGHPATRDRQLTVIHGGAR